MSCIGDCVEIGPPPDNILFLPPPPAPNFVSNASPSDFLPINTSSCTLAQLCEPFLVTITAAPKLGHASGDYFELPGKDIEVWTGIGDTWLLVLVASSIGVLLLGALLAMFLLKCREMNMFGHNDCGHRQMKQFEPRDCTTVTNINGGKFGPSGDTMLYQGNSNSNDNRMVWAAITPRGTQHFVTEKYPNDLIDYSESEDHYETIDNITEISTPNSHYTNALNKILDKDISSFEDSGFVDGEYEDPMPVITYQNSLDGTHYDQLLNNSNMRCADNVMKTNVPFHRPIVSLPTRIEHPNMPPLNLYPLKGNTLNKNGTLNYRGVEGALPKYGL